MQFKAYSDKWNRNWKKLHIIGEKFVVENNELIFYGVIRTVLMTD